MMRKALLLVASLFTFGLAVDAQAETYNIFSNTFWTVADAAGNPLVNARNVCLNATSPSNCPSGAINYGYPSSGWNANIPGATWIWAEVDPTASPANNAEFTFQTPFWLCSTPQDGGTISVAADNSAEVFLNGRSVLVATDPSTSTTTTVSAADLYMGQNIITVKAKNAPGCTSSQYQCNPAGVLLGASFKDALPEKPKCDGGSPVGTIDRNSCPQGQSGSLDRVCACLGTFTFWHPIGSCTTPTPACTGYTYSAWSACGTDGQQTRTITGNTPAGCTGTPSTQPVLTQACTYVPPTCASFTYSAWGQCQPDNTQTRTVLTSSPAGCTGGAPVTTQSCTYVPPLVGVGDMCAKDRGNEWVGTCPTGTTCAGRYIPAKQGNPPWCIFVLWIPQECRRGDPEPAKMTTDWFCD
jgi:hypothetical protein